MESVPRQAPSAESSFIFRLNQYVGPLKECQELFPACGAARVDDHRSLVGVQVSKKAAVHVWPRTLTRVPGRPQRVSRRWFHLDDIGPNVCEQLAAIARGNTARGNFDNRHIVQ